MTIIKEIIKDIAKGAIPLLFSCIFGALLLGGIVFMIVSLISFIMFSFVPFQDGGWILIRSASAVGFIVGMGTYLSVTQ